MTLRAILKKEIAHHPSTQGEGGCKGAAEHSRIQHFAFARRSTAFLSSSFWMRFRFDGKQSGDCSTCIRVQPSVGSAQHWLAPGRAQAHEASACSRNMICVPSASAAPSASFFDHRLGRSREDCFCRKTPNVMVLFRKKST